jgi:hypothetical protein
MAVRNWWIEADIDGRQTYLSGGPRNKGGGFRLDIYQRSNGNITKAGYLEGFCGADGQLVLRGDVGGTYINYVTKR